MRAGWQKLAPRFTAYELHLPGSPSFVCLVEKCPAHCCKIYTVSLNAPELERLTRFSGLEPVDLLECEDGQPITLPLAQPYILARRDGKCALLGDDLRCSQYEGRPESCRLYPHFIIFLNEETGRPVYSELDAMTASIRAVVNGEDPGPLVPLLLRHLECPGFDGEPIAEDAWVALARETFQLQYFPMQEVKWHR